MTSLALHHKPVLLTQCMDWLQPVDGGVYVDCTANGGGHIEEMLKRSAPTGRVIGLDLDAQVIEYTRQRLSSYGERLQMVQTNFAELAQVLEELEIEAVDGILADLGLSSRQLDDPERGFSFRFAGPIDMRMDQSRGNSAKDLIEQLDTKQLATIISRYGEERNGYRIARALKEALEAGELNDMTQLASIVEQAIPRRFHPKRIHAATQTCQALRIAVNGELDSLEALLPQALHALKPSGRLAVISYHSLEDRIVRHTMRDWTIDCICPPDLPVCGCDKRREAVVLTRKPILPSEKEIEANPRARSAKLRVAERSVR